MRVTDPQRRVWEIERHVFELPQWLGLGSPGLDPTDGVVAGGGILGAVVGALFLILVRTIWPAFLYLGRLAVALVVAGGRLLRGRRVVVATTRGERQRWEITGTGRSRGLAVRVARAIAAGSDPPPGGAFETMASAVLDEADVARQRPRGNVRVIRR